MKAPAKLNLGLRVLGRRDDGYHLLQSLVVFLDLADEVEIVPALRWQVALTGPFSRQLAGEENIVLRAGRKLAERAMADAANCADLAAAISLTKNIPVAAGLGGGSADAAAVLRGLNDMWQLGLAAQELQELATPLGADIPMCLAGVAAMIGGGGEKISPLALPPLHLLIVNPGIPVATKDVFARLRPPYAEELPAPAAIADAAAVALFARDLGNSLAGPAIELCPTIAAVLDDIDALENCRLAQMSGSGASCFGLFDDRAVAEQAANALKAARPSWFVRACSTVG